MKHIEFEDKNIKRCEINECHDGSTSAFLQLDFNHQSLCGIEIMLTKEELELMLKAINDDEKNELLGPDEIESGEPAINIVLKDDEDTPDSRFIEVENDKGESIKVGEWVKKNNDGYSYLRIKRSDIK